MVAFVVAAATSAAVWLVLAFGRGSFWRARPRLPRSPVPARWPSVAVVVPARDEASLLPLTLPGLLAQRYAGDARVVLVDDQSTDGTAAVARAIAEAHAGGNPLPLVVAGTRPTPPGWAGKLWALQEGLEQVGDVDMVLFTDADIAHPPDSLARLVAAAEEGGWDQVSLMARLDVTDAWDRLLIPSFVYFFAMLYPFRWVARRPLRRRTPPSPRRAAAAGGCLLVRRAALAAAGGIAVVRGAVIDDVSLARALARAGGRLWLGYGEDVRSVRRYDGLGPLWAMVTRSAYVQLRCSPVALAGTVAGLLLVFAVPPVAALVGVGLGWSVVAALGAGTWALMAATAVPMQRHHGLRRWRALTLPVAALVYLAMTVDSARRHHRGEGAAWKGRTYGPEASLEAGHRSRRRPTRTTIPGSGDPNSAAGSSSRGGRRRQDTDAPTGPPGPDHAAVRP